MAANKALEQGRSIPMKVPSTVHGGDPLVFGATYGASLPETNLLCGVAIEDATDAFLVALPLVGVDRWGAYNLAVQGEGGSPLVFHALKQGDPVYADINGPGSSYDSTTNCWTGFVLNSNGQGVLFGYVLDAVTVGAGLTTVRVVLR